MLEYLNAVLLYCYLYY